MNYQVIVLGLIKQEKPENSVDFRIKTNQRSNICKNQVERKVLFYISTLVSMWVQHQFPVTIHKLKEG